MKARFVCWCIGMLLCCNAAFAQTDINTNSLKHLYLYNSEGKTAGDKDSTISTSFFFAKWIAIGCAEQIDNELNIYCVTQPLMDEPTALYISKVGKLPHEALAGIALLEKGSVITFVAKTKVLSFYSLRFVIE